MPTRQGWTGDMQETWKDKYDSLEVGAAMSSKQLKLKVQKAVMFHNLAMLYWLPRDVQDPAPGSNRCSMCV